VRLALVVRAREEVLVGDEGGDVVRDVESDQDEAHPEAEAGVVHGRGLGPAVEGALGEVEEGRHEKGDDRDDERLAMTLAMTLALWLLKVWRG
jgi:hypothetical protein